MDADELPEHGRLLPGVWRNKNSASFRVPLNCASLLGFRLPPSWGEDIGEQAVEGLAGLPMLKPEALTLLREHQRRMLVRSLVRPGFHLWAPPGAGKTLTGLCWSAWDTRGMKLVVTKAAARGTWVEEVRKWTNFEPRLLLGHAAEEPSKDENIIYITAWETLTHWRKALVTFRPDSIVFDESHCMKQPKRAKPLVQPDGEVEWIDLENQVAAAAAISDASHRRLAMTATPIPNTLLDLWGQLDIVERWQWGGKRGFGEHHCNGHSNGYGMVYDGMSNTDELNERLKLVKHKIGQSALAKTLPPRRRQIIRLGPEDQDKPADGFASAIKVAARAAREGDRDPLFEVLLQEAATRKRRRVLEIVTEAVACKLKVVVFTGRRRDCDELGGRITTTLGSSVKVWCAHGGTDAGARDGIRKLYMQTPGPAVLVGTGDAWGESVNLQDTDLALIVQLPWTPRQVRQWEGRFVRLGQVRPVLVQYLVASGTVDDDVSDVLLGKLPPVSEIVQDEELDSFEADFTQVEPGDLLARVSGGSP
jgi:superfamily II DNA or RNA helicase